MKGESGSVPKRKPTLYAALRFVQAQHVFSALPTGGHIGGHDEVGLALGFPREGSFQEEDRPLSPPDLFWYRIGAWAATSDMTGAARHLKDDIQPRRDTFPRLRAGGLRISFTSERSLLESAHALGPGLLLLLRLALEVGSLPFHPLGASSPGSSAPSGRRWSSPAHTSAALPCPASSLAPRPRAHFPWVEVSGTRLIHQTLFRSRSVIVASL
jgi:hypothetical protein